MHRISVKSNFLYPLLRWFSNVCLNHADFLKPILWSAYNALLLWLQKQPQKRRKVPENKLETQHCPYKWISQLSEESKVPSSWKQSNRILDDSCTTWRSTRSDTGKHSASTSLSWQWSHSWWPRWNGAFPLDKFRLIEILVAVATMFLQQLPSVFSCCQQCLARTSLWHPISLKSIKVKMVFTNQVPRQSDRRAITPWQITDFNFVFPDDEPTKLDRFCFSLSF